MRERERAFTAVTPLRSEARLLLHVAQPKLTGAPCKAGLAPALPQSQLELTPHPLIPLGP